MPKFFVKSNQITENKIFIKDNDVNHIQNVLRMKIGDKLNVCNADSGMNYYASIEEFKKNEIICEIIKKIDSNAESNVEVHIYQGLPKADKMEMIIQKAVELGVKEITPIEMRRCVVKLTDKDKLKKVERWNKIAEVAAKQSGRDTIPNINEIVQLKDIVSDFSKYDIIIVCYENEKNVTLKSILKKYNEYSNIKIAVVIGPEGGIEESEIEYMKDSGADVITLGNRILRTETVALSILSIIIYEFERNNL